MRKGIILAGGTGSRLFPLTFTVTKQLLPIHDKPMIFYPLSTLLDLNIKDILIISTEEDKPNFQKLLGDGSDLGIKLSYNVQKKPNGIAEGLIIAEEFLSGSPCAFILGDNLFIGSITKGFKQSHLTKDTGATIFTYKVIDPERYGVVSLNAKGHPLQIEEKPILHLSNNAITGLYFFDERASQIAKSISPSNRGELEITDVNKFYLNNNLLEVKILDDEITWLDAGTINSLYEASNLVVTIEKRTGKKIGCIEEMAFNKKNITLEQLYKSRIKYGSSEYGFYLDKIISNY